MIIVIKAFDIIIIIYNCSTNWYRNWIP